MTTSPTHEPPGADTPERRRAKEIHRRVMLGMGAFTAACGLAGAYLVLSPGGDLPSFMYGRFLPRRSAPEVARRAKASLVAWGVWSPAALAEAQSRDRLILLDLQAFWSGSCRRMEETTYADPEVAAWIKANVAALRVDADERPDLVSRYLSGGWPTTALLLPGGEILAAGTFMTSEQFLPWAKTVAESFSKKRSGVAESAREAQARRRLDWASRAKTATVPTPADALHLSRKELEAKWDAESEGFGSGARFPRFRRILFLWELGPREPWAASMASQAWEGARNLEDPVWGGFYRYAAGPGWQRPEREKLLEDQAEALSAAWALDREAARRLLAFTANFMADPGGGYAESVAPEVLRPDGTIVEAPYYFSLSDRRRKALGLPAADRRLFTAPNAHMIRAVLEGDPTPDQAEFALKSLERFWKEGVKDGIVVHRLGGTLAGLLDDQLAMSEALLAAHRRTRNPDHLAKAMAVLKATEETLFDRASQAYFDRPAMGELPEGLDRALWPDLNARAAELTMRLARALPDSDPQRERLLARVGPLLAWLSQRWRAVGPAEWAWLVREQADLTAEGPAWPPKRKVRK